MLKMTSDSHSDEVMALVQVLLQAARPMSLPEILGFSLWAPKRLRLSSMPTLQLGTRSEESKMR